MSASSQASSESFMSCPTLFTACFLLHPSTQYFTIMSVAVLSLERVVRKIKENKEGSDFHRLDVYGVESLKAYVREDVKDKLDAYEFARFIETAFEELLHILLEIQPTTWVMILVYHQLKCAILYFGCLSVVWVHIPTFTFLILATIWFWFRTARYISFHMTKPGELETHFFQNAVDSFFLILWHRPVNKVMDTTVAQRVQFILLLMCLEFMKMVGTRRHWENITEASAIFIFALILGPCSVAWTQLIWKWFIHLSLPPYFGEDNRKTMQRIIHNFGMPEADGLELTRGDAAHHMTDSGHGHGHGHTEHGDQDGHTGHGNDHGNTHGHDHQEKGVDQPATAVPEQV